MGVRALREVAVWGVAEVWAVGEASEGREVQAVAEGSGQAVLSAMPREEPVNPKGKGGRLALYPLVRRARGPAREEPMRREQAAPVAARAAVAADAPFCQASASSRMFRTIRLLSMPMRRLTGLSSEHSISSIGRCRKLLLT